MSTSSAAGSTAGTDRGARLLLGLAALAVAFAAADTYVVVLALVDMTKYAERLPAQLSGGEQQMCAIARG